MRIPLAVLCLAALLGACEESSPAPARATCSRPIAGAGGTASVRVIALGIKEDVAGMRTYADYRRLIAEAMAAEAPCFTSTPPTLVVLPENTALMAGFIGSRGARARARTDSVAAFADLLQDYKQPIEYYREKFPETPPLRRLLMAMTDTLGRAVETTFPGLARRYGVYLAISIDAAEYVETGDPAVVAAVGDPDLPGLTSAYVAEQAEVYNMSLVYGPDGRELGRVRKAYLTPPERDLLQLNYGSLEQLRPIETPFGRLAPVISKDGWMPDVLERFNELGADITLQHEAFSGWAIEEQEGDWLPDVMMQSVWSHAQAYDSLRYGVLPCMTGNLLDLVFDCQSAITKELAEDDAPLAFIGREPGAGFLDIGAWAMADPGPADRALPLDKRRSILRERGEAMVPGAGAPYENAYVVSTARGDASHTTGASGLPSRAPATSKALGENGTLAVGGNGETENAIQPDVAFDGAAYHVVFGVETAGRREVRYARVQAGKASASAKLPFTAGRPYAARVTVAAGALYVVAVQDEAAGSSRLSVLKSVDGGAKWAPLPPAFQGEGAWARWNPAIAAAGNRLYVAWTDRRDGASDIYLAASQDGGATFAARRLDEPHADQDIASEPADIRNNQALPALYATGATVVAVWADFRDYAWDIYGAASTDAGAAFSANLRVNPAAAPTADGETERIFGRSAVAYGAGRLAVAASGVDAREAAHSARVFSAPALCAAARLSCAPAMHAAASSFHPQLTGEAGRLRAVWQALGAGGNDLWTSELTAAGWSAPEPVVTGAGQQFNPRLAPGAVVWEDWRSGHGQIGFATLK